MRVNLALCWIYSRVLALQTKAIEEGLCKDEKKMDGESVMETRSFGSGGLDGC